MVSVLCQSSHLRPLFNCKTRKFQFLERTISSLNSVKNIISSTKDVGKCITVKGWVKSERMHKGTTFLNITDGSCLDTIQSVMPTERVPRGATYGSCVEVTGHLIKSPGPAQLVELQIDDIKVLGTCNGMDYPFKNRKHHPLDYVRQFLHLRPRTNQGSAVLRIRSTASKAVHDFFHQNNYIQVQTPVLTSNDCEGAGEVFQVKPAAKANIVEERDEFGRIKEFFNTPAYLTVSGQLHLEAATGAYPKVYTFSPSFRAETSRGRNHLSEFQMIEAELAFINSLEILMETVECLIKFITERLTEKCTDDLNWCHKHLAEKNHKTIIDNVLKKPFLRLTYKEAIEVLEKKNSIFKFPIKWGDDLKKEHEKYLVSYCNNIPVFITDYPAQCKPFYCRPNDDGNTVAAVDLLGAWVGELCGGSLREERYDMLNSKLKELELDSALDWYLDLRRFGSCPHGGFGIGFERYIQMILGINHIKDVVPFPRSQYSCKL